MYGILAKLRCPGICTDGHVTDTFTLLFKDRQGYLVVLQSIATTSCANVT